VKPAKRPRIKTHNQTPILKRGLFPKISKRGIRALKRTNFKNRDSGKTRKVPIFSRLSHPPREKETRCRTLQERAQYLDGGSRRENCLR